MFRPRKHYHTATPLPRVPVTVIPDGEPYFTLRARDYCSVHALESYVDYIGECGVSDDHRNGAKAAVRDFKRWQQANADTVRLPD